MTPRADVARPEHQMVRRAAVVGALALPFAAALGASVRGTDGALSAGLGVVVVVLNFVAHGLSLAWAAGISIALLQGVALGGVVVRMGIIVTALFALDRTEFFSPAVFGLTVVVGTMALLGYEARLVSRGLGGELQIPPDPAAAAARERLGAEEALR